MIPRSAKFNQDNPFSALHEEILNNSITNANKKLNGLFKSTKQQFRAFQNSFYQINNDLTLLCKLIDRAHTIMKRKSDLLKRHLKNKLDTIFETSLWVKFSDPSNIINLSDYQLNKTEKALLGYGLAFSMDNPDPWIDLTKNFKNWKDRGTFEDINPDTLFGILLQITAEKQKRNKFPRRFYTALWNLQQNPDITISRSDKGNNIVILKTTEYLQKSYSLLNNTNTYTLLTSNPTKNSQSSFNNNLNKILFSSKDLIKKFKSYLPSLSQFYAIPKIHKQNIPLRPIISNTNCITYNLSKWLADELKPLIGKISNSHITNTEHFIQKIRTYNFTNFNPVSFDVESLFTNVPVNFTIDLLEKHITENNINFSLPFNTIKKTHQPYSRARKFQVS